MSILLLQQVLNLILKKMQNYMGNVLLLIVIKFIKLEMGINFSNVISAYITNVSYANQNNIKVNLVSSINFR